MALFDTFKTYNGDGVTFDFAIPFAYDDVSEIQVTRKNGAVTYTFPNASTIRITSPAALAVGDTLTIQRSTNIDSPKVVFKNGAGVTATQLNSVLTQFFRGLNEVKDTAFRGLYLLASGVFDAVNARITNLGTPTDVNDAARLADIQAAQMTSGNIPTPVLAQVGYYLKATAVGAYAWADAAATFLSRASNLSDLANVTTARTNLGVYSTAQVDSAISAAQSAASASGATAGALLDQGAYKNKLWNPRFEVWQRGTSIAITATDTYTADRWSANFDGTGGTVTVSRQAFTLGQSVVPNNPKYFLRHATTVARTSPTFSNIVQRLEGVDNLAGQQITVTFWAKADAARTIDVGFYQSFGTGGSPSSPVFTSLSGAVSLTTSWQKFTITGTVPSVSGKTLGSNNDDYNQLSFGLPLTVCTIDIAEVQLEIGPNSTAFEIRPYHVEYFNCRRYYKTFTGYYVPTGTAQTIQHTPSMRKVPVVTGGGAGFSTATNNVDITTIQQTTSGSQNLVFNAEL